MTNIKKYVAELFGTLVLVFMGCGSAMLLGTDVAEGHLAVAFAFGLSIVAMAYVIGSVSGCHINPAVSLAMLLNKRIKVVDFIGYVVAQCVGAIAGAGLLYVLVEFFGVIDYTGAFGANGIDNAGGIVGALIVEAILTCIFVLTVLGVTADSSKGSVAGIVIGLTLTFVHIVGIPLTGTSVNPARSLGPAIFAGGDALTNVWVFVAGPLAGAVLAALLFLLFKPKASLAQPTATPVAAPAAAPQRATQSAPAGRPAQRPPQPQATQPQQPAKPAAPQQATPPQPAKPAAPQQAAQPHPARPAAPQQTAPPQAAKPAAPQPAPQPPVQPRPAHPVAPQPGQTPPVSQQPQAAPAQTPPADTPKP